MKYTMGHFGEAGVATVTADQTFVVDSAGQAKADITQVLQQPLSPQQTSALFTTASNLADKSLSMSLDKLASLAQAEEVQMFIKENGLEPYLRDVNKDRIKNILALFGLWQVYKVAKSPVFLLAAAGLGVFALYSNKDKLVSKISSQVAS